MSTSFTVPAGTFRSFISQADANAQASAYLQTLIATGCSTFTPLDYAVLRYIWGSGAGVDLDTTTALVYGDPTYNGGSVGYCRGGTVGPGGGPYLTWGGDNVGVGLEAILINFKNVVTNNPGDDHVTISLATNWYNTLGTGDITLEFQTYLGGTMSQVGFDFVNTGYTSTQTISFSRNSQAFSHCPVTPDPAGTLVYTVATKTGLFIPA